MSGSAQSCASHGGRTGYEKAFKDRVKRIHEVNSVIEKLDPSIRTEAFAILRQYVTESAVRDLHCSVHKKDLDAGTLDAESFFSKHTEKKPADNATLVAAFLYGQYGAEAFSIEEIRKLADDVGITMSDRLDMTFIQAKRDGKSLFRKAGKGQFKPTVHGESYFKATYEVSKGHKKRPADTQS